MHLCKVGVSSSLKWKNMSCDERIAYFRDYRWTIIEFVVVNPINRSYKINDLWMALDWFEFIRVTVTSNGITEAVQEAWGSKPVIWRNHDSRSSDWILQPFAIMFCWAYPNARRMQMVSCRYQRQLKENQVASISATIIEANIMHELYENDF